MCLVNEIDGKDFILPFSCILKPMTIFFRRLAGRYNTVYTGVVVKAQDKVVKFTEKADVLFGKIHEDQIRGYIATGEPM